MYMIYSNKILLDLVLTLCRRKYASQQTIFPYFAIFPPKNHVYVPQESILWDLGYMGKTKSKFSEICTSVSVLCRFLQQLAKGGQRVLLY